MCFLFQFYKALSKFKFKFEFRSLWSACCLNIKKNLGETHFYTTLDFNLLCFIQTTLVRFLWRIVRLADLVIIMVAIFALFIKFILVSTIYSWHYLYVVLVDVSFWFIVNFEHERNINYRTLSNKNLYNNLFEIR